MTEAVTITLSPDIVWKLDELKSGEETSYEEVIALIVEEAYDDAWLTEEKKQEVLQSLSEVEAGNYYTHKEIKEMIDRKTA